MAGVRLRRNWVCSYCAFRCDSLREVPTFRSSKECSIGRLLAELALLFLGSLSRRRRVFNLATFLFSALLYTLYTYMNTKFSKHVYAVVQNIPRGSVLTYKEIARRAGRPRAYRVVGNILNSNHNPDIPCHRVVRSDGTPGGYNRGRGNKIKLLRKEGVL